VLPAISFVGPHNVGKTSLLEKIVARLDGMGVRVGLIKHAPGGFDLGGEGKDSARLYRAGAQAVVLATSGCIAHYRRTRGEVPLAELLESLAGEVDLVIVEGFKQEGLPKVEVLRREVTSVPLGVDNLVAVVADFPLPEGEVPTFDLQDVAGLTAFILRACGLREPDHGG
jgi:molybdopterin-guanine dinucleotide biosynthesis protein B